MMVWVDILAVLLCSIVGTVIGIFIMLRPITNLVAQKVHRKLLKTVASGEDKFASRSKI